MDTATGSDVSTITDEAQLALPCAGCANRLANPVDIDVLANGAVRALLLALNLQCFDKQADEGVKFSPARLW